jgi:hypothetical protein
VQVDHLTPAQVKALRIADNRIAANSGFDQRLLGEAFQELSLLELDFGLDITGFDLPEKAAYSELLNVCVWDKGRGGMGSFYRSQHEFVFVFKNGHAPHTNNVQLGKFGRNRTNVWGYPGINNFGRSGEEGDLLKLHPTVKPVRMLADAILDCTNRGAIVLDCFLGSGSTLIACERTGRVGRGIEIDPLYVDTAIRRWQKYTGDQAINVVTGRTFADHEAEVARV